MDPLLSAGLRRYVVESLMDVDFYKFTMGQLVFKKYRGVVVTFAFRCRTKGAELARRIDIQELRWQLDHVRSLRFSQTALNYLRGINEGGERMFDEAYLEFLRQLELPEYDLREANGDFILEFTGCWAEVIYWETIALAIINELYYRSLMALLTPFEIECVYATGRLRLQEKIRRLKERPEVIFTDFGTRRRFNFSWQDYAVGILADELPRTQFVGTSNVHLAHKHGLKPMGTSAHERDMVMAGLMAGTDEGIRQSVKRSLDDWWEEYGQKLSIALTDTFGTDFFFRSMTPEQARNWKGLRQDSGDPIQFGEKAIAFYKACGVDPEEKILVFSDGLDLDAIFRITDHFRGRVKTIFGWGTNLTNDLGFAPLSLVIKAVRADGRGLVKLSDNLAKAIGDPQDVERYKRVCGYTGRTYQDCRY